MNNISVRSSIAIIIICSLSLLLGLAPSKARADELSVKTAQILPMGGNSCGQLSVSGFTPFIYDGALNAFEFTVTDSSYVAVAGSAGKTSIPFNQMTRRLDQSGNLRIHADIDSTPIGQGIVVIVTMLAAKSAPQVVCISIVSGTTGNTGTAPVSPIPSPSPIPGPAHGPSPIPSPAPSPISKGGGTTGTKPSTGTKIVMTPPSPTPSKVSPTPSAAAPVSSTQNILKTICAGGGASRLWFILLAIYAIIVAAAVFGQPQLPAAMRSQEWVAAAIVVPFLLLFGLWYFAESCRVSAWVPAIATLIALAGLAAAFWDRGSGTRVINLPSAKA